VPRASDFARFAVAPWTNDGLPISSAASYLSNLLNCAAGISPKQSQSSLSRRHCNHFPVFRVRPGNPSGKKRGGLRSPLRRTSCQRLRRLRRSRSHRWKYSEGCAQIASKDPVAVVRLDPEQFVMALLAEAVPASLQEKGGRPNCPSPFCSELLENSPEEIRS
jgi:hypothetical protein